MSYRFKFGFWNDWLREGFQPDANKSIYEAHSERTQRHQVLYIYNDADLWGTVQLSEELYLSMWESLNVRYAAGYLVEDITDSDNSGYKIYCLMHTLKTNGNVTTYLKVTHWLEQEYMKRALNHHQAAAGPGTAGPEDTESSHRSVAVQT